VPPRITDADELADRVARPEPLADLDLPHPHLAILRPYFDQRVLIDAERFADLERNRHLTFLRNLVHLHIRKVLLRVITSVKNTSAGLDASDYRVERLRAGRARGGTGCRLRSSDTAARRPRR
jgi:hypothetical protein